MTQSTLELRRARLNFSERGLVLPLALFAGVVSAYGGTVFAILAGGPLTASALVPLCGILVMMLFVIGHDACHQSYTSSRAINHLIGRLAFLPALHSFSLWDREHNQRHHRFNNIRHLDYAWIPMSPDQYRAAGAYERLRYRFYRHPAGVPFYYLFEIWAQRKVLPRPSLVGPLSAAYLADTALVLGFLAAFSTVIAIGGAAFGKSALESLTLALLLPFLIFNALMSMAIFLHHTHHEVPGYGSVAEWQAGEGAVYGTVHVEFPPVLRHIILNIMEHRAHHYAPGVPLYHLADMQAAMQEPRAISWQVSPDEYLNICARCKLFDYTAGRWFNFKGEATSEPMRPRAG
jgi:omega-6 fatty acid desaturase (delta-12 desaturase)